MSLSVLNKITKKYAIKNPLAIALTRKKSGLGVMVTILNDKKAGKEELQIANDSILAEHPDFKNTPKQVTALNEEYDIRIAKAEKEYEGIKLHYRYPSHPEVHALMQRHSTNGKIDEALFSEDKRDSNAMVVFSYDAAKLFLIGWEELVDVDDKGNEFPLPFNEEEIERIPNFAIVAFAGDIIIEYISEVIFGKPIDEKKSNPEEEPVPN